MPLTLHCVQSSIIWEDKPANFERVRSLVRTASPEQGGLIVLPEMFATGFSKNLQATAEPAGGPTELFALDLARETGCAVMVGLTCIDPGSAKGRNISLTVSPDGKTLAKYAKRRPFTLGGEHTVHSPGQEATVFEWQGFVIAPLICYDLRFPELAREAVAKGANLLVYTASWPIKRTQHWVTLLQARAIENLAWVAGVNRTGTDLEFTYPGRSMVIDPQGVIVADAADREQVVTCTIQKEVAESWRRDFPALRDAGLAD